MKMTMKRLILISVCFAAASGSFAQNAQCVKTSVNLTGNQMTLTSSGAKTEKTTEGYVYYEKKRKKNKKDQETHALPGVAATNPSRPVMLNDAHEVNPVPEKYTVLVTTPEPSGTACADSAMNVNTMLNVERVASYTGNYPEHRTDKRYTELKKRHYKMALRKKRKIEKKEEKIARRAEVNVEVKSDAEAKKV